MKLDEKIIEELKKHNKINKYIMEQGAELPPPPADPTAAGVPPAEGAPVDPLAAGAPPADPTAAGTPPPAAPPEGEKVDTATDPDVEKIDSEGKESEKGKEIEVTDLVKSQQNVEKKQEEYFDNLFKHLDELEGKLSVMDTIMNKLNDLEVKVEKYRTKTPEEKLELRSLDSGPYNQKLTDFFVDKQEEMEKSGKNEYVLTQQDVESYSPTDIKRSFRAFDEDQPEFTNFKRVQ